MSTQYIVKFSKNLNSLFPSEKVDGFVELIPSKNKYSSPTISVRTHQDSSDTNNIQLLYKFITSNFAKVDFDDNKKICSINYSDGYSRSIDYNSSIEFDDSSSSAYSKFKKSFEELLNSSKKTIYYDSGRVKYIGDVITEEEKMSYNGEGSLYFDCYKNTLKYTGEFEEDDFDGAGKFYNMDGNVTLMANNISNGIPVQNGKLHINFRNREEIIDINFTELWVKLGVDSKDDRRKLVKSDDFLNVVASYYITGTSKNIKQLLFEDKSVPEQNIELWNQVQDLKVEVLKSRNDLNINLNNLVRVGKTFTSLLIFNIMLNMVVIYLR